MTTTHKASVFETVEEVRPVVEANIKKAERGGTLPAEVVQAFIESGLMGMKLPKELGGSGATLVEQAKAIKAMSYNYPSAGWCLMIGTTSVWLPAVFLSPEARQKLFVNGLPLAATVVRVTGQAVPAEGGYILNGEWHFASGIHHAEWVTAQALVVRDGEPAGPRMFTFPAGAAQVRDNWHDVLGLRGTGSASFSVSDLFVPSEFSWDMDHDKPFCGEPLSLLGIPGSIFYEHVFFALGVAQCASDDLIERAPTLSRSYGPPAAALAENQAFQEDIARMRMDLDSVEARAMQLLEEALAIANTGTIPDMASQVKYRAFAAYATQIALAITNRCFAYAGGRAAREHDTLNMCMRDMQTAAQHFLPNPNVSYQKYGRVLLGGKNVHAMI